MDILTLIVVLVPSVLSIVLAITNMVITSKNRRLKQRDLAWNAAAQMLNTVMAKDNDASSAPLKARENVMYFDFVYQSLVHIAAEDADKLKKHLQGAPMMWPLADCLGSPPNSEHH